MIPKNLQRKVDELRDLFLKNIYQNIEKAENNEMDFLQSEELMNMNIVKIYQSPSKQVYVNCQEEDGDLSAYFIEFCSMDELYKIVKYINR